MYRYSGLLDKKIRCSWCTICCAPCLFFILFLLSGCQGKDTKQTLDIQAPPDEQTVAVECERQKKYLEALRHWQNARKEIDEKISDLESRIAKIRTDLLDKGMKEYKAGQGNAAAASFSKVLFYDPDNMQAHDYLLDRLRPSRYISYTVQDGDDLQKITRQVYGTSSESEIALVRLYLKQKESDFPEPGTIVKLPELNSYVLISHSSYMQDMLQARQLFVEKDYEHLLPLVTRMRGMEESGQEVSYLYNQALLGVGRARREERQYTEAIGFFKKIDPRFKDMREEIEQTLQLQKRWLSGENAHHNEELMRKAKALQVQGELLQARDVLEKIDADYQGIEEAKSSLAAAIHKEAEEQYKQGVNLFVNDQLAAAIKAWEKTLTLEPHHQKAAESIEKAKELLKKVDAIDTGDAAGH